MCIIIYKPENVAFPSDDIIKNCFDNNPDGAGFMFANGFRVVIKKGFMHYGEFKKALDKTRKAHGDKLPYVLHFRISTQAGVRADNCHPFPLSRSMDDLRALKTATSIGVAHNGIISLTSSYSKTITHSDTMQFITEYLTLIIKSIHYYENGDNLKLITKLIGSSRLAILNAEKHCQLLGTGWVCDGGCYYSNGGYKTSKKTTATPASTNYNSYYGSNYGSYYGSNYGSYYGSYSNEADYYERYYNPAMGVYIFPPMVCPKLDDGTTAYCEYCSDRLRCTEYKKQNGHE